MAGFFSAVLDGNQPLVWESYTRSLAGGPSWTWLSMETPLLWSSVRVGVCLWVCACVGYVWVCTRVGCLAGFCCVGGGWLQCGRQKGSPTYGGCSARACSGGVACEGLRVGADEGRSMASWGQRGQGHSSILRRVLGAHDSPGELVEEIRKLRTSSAKYMCSSPYFREIPNLRTFQLMVEFHKGAGLTSFFGKAPLSLDSNTRIKAALHVYGGALEVVFFVTRSWYFFHLWRLTTIEKIQKWVQWLWSSEKRIHPFVPGVIKWDPFWGGSNNANMWYIWGVSF